MAFGGRFTRHASAELPLRATAHAAIAVVIFGD